MTDSSIKSSVNENLELLNQLKLFEWMVKETPLKFFGDSILQTPCKSIKKYEIKSKETLQIVDLMTDTLKRLRERTGFGRGLAANQIGFNKRIIVLFLDNEPEVFINPEIISSEGSGSYWECCFSSGAFLIGEVIRPWKAKFKYLDLEGEEHIIDANEKYTRLFMHEIEHLDGHNCTESYLSKTLRFVRKGKEEIFGYEFKKIKS